VNISAYSLHTTLFAVETVGAFCRIGIEFLRIMEICSRSQDKPIGVIAGFFGLGVNADLLPKFYFVLKSHSSAKAKADISQKTLAAKGKPSTFTLVTFQPTSLHQQDERDNA
jgi:hypothetical protein